jgi:hypothetical protein
MAYLCVGLLYPIMTILTTLQNLEDIKLLVDTFYSKVQTDRADIQWENR